MIANQHVGTVVALAVEIEVAGVAGSAIGGEVGAGLEGERLPVVSVSREI